MKSLPLFALIIVSLIAFVPFIEGHTIWIQNKLVKGTWASAAGTLSQESNFDWNGNDAWAQDSSMSHAGFSLAVPDNITSFYLIFGVGLSLEKDKWRGPFNNTQDYCFHFHGHFESWELFTC